ncbi:DUF2855 family protein [Alteromonas sp. H39]|uniref:DUF2855 family protein n=1 Tax=Alteromonas sp. H39 TaxID=3389876 RepID=UPI0039E10328
MSLSTQQIWVDKQDLNDTKVVQDTLTDDVLGKHDVLLKIEQFGFSANNITYASMGEKMGYWGFFPAGAGYGIIPVWGFAIVQRSMHPDIKEGERIFGYLPMASHWVIRAGNVNEYGFKDVHPNRKSISQVYDQYLRCEADPAYNLDKEVWQQAFRPLFMTSFVLDEYVFNNVVQSAILISSASSKTATGCACLMRHQREKRESRFRIIGLTSEANRDMVCDSNCYDEVMTYGEANTLPGDDTYWLLDFAANGDMLTTLKEHLGEALDRITLIGATDWQSKIKPDRASLNADIFFAPAHVKHLQQEWGHEGFLSRYATAWKLFGNTTTQTYYEETHEGVNKVLSVYKDTLAGLMNPNALLSLKF